MSNKPKMNSNMKKSWGSEIINSIYETVSGSQQPAQKKPDNPRRRVDKNKAKDFMRGFHGDEE